MEIREVESLVAVAVTGSILKTAQQRNLSSGAVHKHLKTLEAELSVKLYEKCGGKLSLTAAGKYILPHLRQLLAHHETAIRSLADWQGTAKGAVRVGAGPAFSSSVLPLILKRFRRQFPAVELYVETGNRDDLIRALEDRTLDLTFDLNYGVGRHAGLIPVLTWRCPLIPVAAASHPRRHYTLKQIEKLPFIMYARGTRINSLVQRYFDDHNVEPRVIMRSDSAEAIQTMVCSGLGVSMLFLYSVDSEIRLAKLRRLRLDAPDLFGRMSLMRNKYAYASRAVASFVEVARKMRLPRMVLESDCLEEALCAEASGEPG